MNTKMILTNLKFNFSQCKIVFCALIILFSYSNTIAQEDNNKKDSASSPTSVEAEIDCGIKPLKITRFRDKVKRSKKWKIVVGRPIAFRAMPRNGSNYNWSILDNTSTPFWNFNENIRHGNATIPADNTMSAVNNDFGETNGIVQVTYTDNGGTPTTALSTDPSPNPDRRIEVFFNKNEMSPHEVAVPNWFFYWRQIQEVQNHLEVEMMIFDYDNGYFLQDFNIDLQFSDVGDFQFNPCTTGGKLGLTSSQANNFIPLDVANPGGTTIATNFDFDITMGEGTGQICGHDYVCTGGEVTVPAGSGTGSTGISCFYQVLRHEREHVEIYRENWPNGRLSDGDTDGDGYSDQFEMTHAAAHGFDYLNPNDAYSMTTAAGCGGAIPSNMMDPCISVGYRYEEIRCRNIEDTVDNEVLNDDDWSFDPTGVYQGKNW